MMICKKYFDIFLGFLILIFILPIIFIFCLLIYLYDKSNPIYISKRIGFKGKSFNLFKIRSMVINADKLGGTSTSQTDKRLIPLGKLIRKLKLDEFTQIINVLNGTMSFVGPRPNTPFDVNLYSAEERKLLNIKPGITDFSSIIFSDEGSILSKFDNPDLAYNQLIRPWKSRLGLFYINKRNLFLDIQLILLTILNSFNRKLTLDIISNLIKQYGGSFSLIKLAKRNSNLSPESPPGFDKPISNI